MKVAPIDTDSYLIIVHFNGGADRWINQLSSIHSFVVYLEEM